MTATVDAQQQLDQRDEPRQPRKLAGAGKGWNVRKIAAYALLVPGAILFVAPFGWLVSASFQPIGDIFNLPPNWIPANPTLDNYATFIGRGRADETGAGTQGAWRWFVNSAFVATTTTVLVLFFDSLAAYVFAKRRFPGRDFIFLLFLATMMVPGQVTLIPNYLDLKHIPLFVVKNRTQWDVLFAGSVLATLPMVVVFMIFQRRFIQGISMSGLKG